MDSITTFVVELIVIGAGTMAALVLFVLAVFGYHWVPVEELTSLGAVIALLPGVYVLGIVTDRLADTLFKSWANALRSKLYPSRDDYHRARTVVYLKSPFRELFEYGRSRLRIARGWALNSVLLAIGLNGFVWAQLPGGLPRVTISLFGSGALLALAVGNVAAWRALALSEMDNVKKQEAILSSLGA